MNIKRINIVFLALVALTVFALSVGLAFHAKAAGGAFLRKATATATTTIQFMTPGTATTTLTFDLGQGTNRTADGTALLEQFTGSSTASILNTDIEYSQDGIDWYAESAVWSIDPNGAGASTTPAIGPLQQFTFTFASSTIDRVGVTSANSRVSTRILNLLTPTRYIRAVFTVPVGAANGSFWAEFVGKQSL